MTKIYLSYGMDKAELADITNWSSDVQSRLESLGYSVFNPIIEQERLMSELDMGNISLNSLKMTDLPRFLTAMSALRRFDINNLLDCDAVVVRLNKTLYGGSGVSGELTVASEMHMPIFGILTEQDLELIPCWLLSCVKQDKLFTNIDSCINYIKNNPIEVCAYD